MENTVGKGENAGHLHFSVDQREKTSFQECLINRLQMHSIWSGPKFVFW